MAPIDSPSATHRVPGTWYHQGGGEDAVLCLHREHGASTVAALTQTMARAIAIVDADLALDTSVAGCGGP